MSLGLLGQADSKPATQSSAAACLVDAARKQIGVTTSYDPAYTALAYPGGDVPLERGVCSDVVVRSLRACGVDLQQRVHEDMKKHFSAYPKRWGLKRPDPNIDHRRVLNLQAFLTRQGKEVPLTKDPRDYWPGDVVVCRLSSGLPHIFLVSDKMHPSGRPLAIHNIGGGTQEEDVLFAFDNTGHYRW